MALWLEELFSFYFCFPSGFTVMMSEQQQQYCQEETEQPLNQNRGGQGWGGGRTHIKKTSKYTLIRFSWRDQQREENHIKLFKDKRVRRRTANQHLYLWSALHSRTRNFHHALHSNCIRLLIYFYFFLSFNKCNVLTVDWYPPRKRNESCLVMITKVSPQ